MLLVLACPKGFEPPFSGIGIRCVIQLRHGQMYAAGYFACRFSFLIRIIFHLKINCKNCCATVFSLYYAVIIQQFFTLSKGNLSLLPTVRRSFWHTFEFFPDFVLLLLLFLQILEQFWKLHKFFVICGNFLAWEKLLCFGDFFVKSLNFSLCLFELSLCLLYTSPSPRDCS